MHVEEAGELVNQVIESRRLVEVSVGTSSTREPFGADVSRSR